MALAARSAEARSRTIEFHFTPAAHLQLALWIESPDGAFLKTVGVTQAVSYRGIGNRPEDSSPDSYFCLSFMERTGTVDQSTREKALDAVTCASGFRSDKGRFMTQADVDGAYWEPVESHGVPARRALDLWSLYPPRRDSRRCWGTPVCFDLPDVDSYDQHARDVMPDIDAVTMATPGEVEQSVMFTVPDEWPDGAYVAWIEASKEGDYNDFFNDQIYPTPLDPPEAWTLRGPRSMATRTAGNPPSYTGSTSSSVAAPPSRRWPPSGTATSTVSVRRAAI